MEKRLAHLRDAIEKGDIPTLEKMVKKLRTTGERGSEVQQAESILKKHQEQKKLRTQVQEDLKAATKSRRVKDLKAILKHAEEIDLPEEDFFTSLINDARKTLILLEGKDGAKAALNLALNETGTKCLKEAISRCVAVGVSKKVLEEARRILNIREAAEKELALAIAEMDEERIMAAMSRAENEGGGEELLADGTKAVELVKERAESKVDLANAITAEASVRHGLLRRAVDRAHACGVLLEEMAEAEQALKWEENCDAAREQFREGFVNRDQDQVQKAIEMGEAADLPEEELSQWKTILPVLTCEGVLSLLFYDMELQAKLDAMQAKLSMRQAQVRQVNDDMRGGDYCLIMRNISAVDTQWARRLQQRHRTAEARSEQWKMGSSDVIGELMRQDLIGQTRLALQAHNQKTRIEERYLIHLERSDAARYRQVQAEAPLARAEAQRRDRVAQEGARVEQLLDRYQRRQKEVQKVEEHVWLSSSQEALKMSPGVQQEIKEWETEEWDPAWGISPAQHDRLLKNIDSCRNVGSE